MTSDQKITATYPYTDEEGNLIYEVARIEPGDNGRKKDFFQRRVLPDGSFSWGLTKDTRRVLYNLPAVLGADEIAICCGEKDCATAIQLGFISTTNSGGEAVKWIDEEGNRPDWVEPLRDKRVIFFPDTDKAGRDHADNIIEALLGVVASLVIVWVNRGKDLTEFFEQGGTNEELNRLIQIAKLPENAPVRRIKELIQRKGSPIARESEKLVLGAVMAGVVPFGEVDLLTIEDFGIDAHKKIFGSLKHLEPEGMTDVKSVIQYLEQQEWLDEIGGVSYLVDLTEDLPGVFNIDSHIEKIQKKAASRRLLIDLVRSAESLAVGADHDEVHAEVSTAIENSVVVASGGLHTSSVVEIVGNFAEFFKKREQGIMCKPIDKLMDECYGLQRKQLVVIGGRPGHGKSSLGSEICAYSARMGNETEIISLEVGKEECLLKMFCQVSKVPYLDVCRGSIDDSQKYRLVKVANAFAPMPLRIADSASWSLLKLRNHLKKRRAMGKPLRLLFIDYLQLLGTGRESRRDLELGQITRGLKLLTLEFDLTIIIGSQLNRELEKANRMPQLSDLRESGSIEQDADLVIFCHQDYSKDSPEEIERDAFLILAKQRNGGTGSFPVKFSKKFAFFYDPALKRLDYSRLLPAAS